MRNSTVRIKPLQCNKLIYILQLTRDHLCLSTIYYCRFFFAPEQFRFFRSVLLLSKQILVFCTVFRFLFLLIYFKYSVSYKLRAYKYYFKFSLPNHSWNYQPFIRWLGQLKYMEKSIRRKLRKKTEKKNSTRKCMCDHTFSLKT